MNQNALLIAIAGGLAVWWLWRRQQGAGGGMIQTASIPEPRLIAGSWQYPTGSLPGPSTSTYRDPSGAVLMRPDAPTFIDWT